MFMAIEISRALEILNDSAFKGFGYIGRNGTNSNHYNEVLVWSNPIYSDKNIIQEMVAKRIATEHGLEVNSLNFGARDENKSAAAFTIECTTESELKSAPSKIIQAIKIFEEKLPIALQKMDEFVNA